jgi:rSAM/selenodomain-associated transferase 1
MPSDLIQIFTRFPIAGLTKTRLIPILGAIKAAEIQKNMTEHLMKSVSDFLTERLASVQVHFEGAHKDDMKNWLGPGWDFVPQTEGHIGERMEQAFRAGFSQGFSLVVLIGSDCPGITANIISSAFACLKTHEVVIGPAADGGYYLIGMKHLTRELFAGISWGTDRVLSQTLQKLNTLRKTYQLIQELHDVDRPDDLPEYYKSIEP